MHHRCTLALRALLTAVLLAAAFTVGIRAETDTRAEGWTTFGAPTGGTYVEVFDPASRESWMPQTNVKSLESVRNPYGLMLTETYLRATLSDAPKGEGYSVIRIYPDGLNLLEFSYLRLLVRVPFSEPAEFRIRLRLWSGLDSLTADDVVSSGDWMTLSADVSGWQQRAFVNAVEIVLIPGDVEPTQFEIGALVADGEADLTLANRFLTFGYQTEGGSAVFDGRDFVLDAGSDGVLTLATDAVRKTYVPGQGTAVVRVVLDNAVTGGTLSLAVSDGNLSVGSFKIMSSCTLYEGENTYLLPYDASLVVYAYRLSFRGLSPDDPKDGVRLREVSLESFAAAQTESLGRITECTLAAPSGNVTISGTLPVSAVADFYGARLELYEIAVGDRRFAPETAEPLESIKISTRFSFTVTPEERKYVPQTARYAVYVYHEGLHYPVAAPRAVAPANAVEASSASFSVVGISGGEPGGVFTANASSVIVDVDVGALISGNKTGKLAVAGGKYYYLNNQTLHELDEELDFYHAADVEIYLRLLPPAEDYEDDVTLLFAVTNILGERYGNVRGIILGEAMNVKAEQTGTEDYAAHCADLLRVVYGAAASHVPDVFVLAPIECSGEAQDSVLFCAALSEAIRADGGMPWGIITSSDDPLLALSHTQNVLSQLKAIGASVPHDIMLQWRAPSQYGTALVLDEYEDACRTAGAAGVRAVFLSLSGRSDADAICEGLKNRLNGNERMLYEYNAEVISADTVWQGTYVLGDFSGSYSTLGWRAGSGCTRLATQAKDMRSGERCLHALFEPADGGMFDPVSGNILWVTGLTDDFSPAPYFSASMQVLTELEGTDTAELTFIFGSGDVRAEYSVTVPVGRTLSILCDLSDFPAVGTVDFAAIAIRCASAASLDVYSLSVSSDEFTDAELAQRFRYRTAPAAGTSAAPQSITPGQIALGALVVLSSAAAIALLSRHRDESGDTVAEPGREAVRR